MILSRSLYYHSPRPISSPAVISCTLPVLRASVTRERARAPPLPLITACCCRTDLFLFYDLLCIAPLMRCLFHTRTTNSPVRHLRLVLSHGPSGLPFLRQCFGVLGARCGVTVNACCLFIPTHIFSPHCLFRPFLIHLSHARVNVNRVSFHTLHLQLRVHLDLRVLSPFSPDLFHSLFARALPSAQMHCLRRIPLPTVRQHCI